MARDLREHILQTASELFYQQGIKATGVDSIVKAAGIAKMSLYKYFPSKDDLVLAHLRRKGELLEALIISGIESHNGSPKQKLLAVFEIFEDFLAGPEFRGCPFINAAAEFAEENGPVQKAGAEFYRSFYAILAKQARQAGISQAKPLAQQLAMLIAGAIVSEQMQRRSEAMRTAAAAAEILIDRYLADSSAE